MNTVTIVREQFSHMGRHSGYDMLCPALKLTDAFVNEVWLESSLPSNYLIKKIIKYVHKNLPNKSPYYRQENLWTEFKAFKRKFSKGDILHILYAENNLGLYAYPRIKKNSRLVVTAHQPFSWWREHKIDILKKFKTTDALIVLSRAERELFCSVLGKDRVHFIPHGVDTDFFSLPSPEEFEKKLITPTKRCLFVGQWLRDFDTLFAVIDHALDKKLDLAFDLVVPDIKHRAPDVEKRLEKYKGVPQVNRYVGIDDDALLALYKKADLLLMPLKNSTANNAIVEAMACGLPIVTNATDGVFDYADETYARICPPKDSASMIAAAQEIAFDNVLQKRMSKIARKTAVEKFSWLKVGQSVSEIYSSLT